MLQIVQEKQDLPFLEIVEQLSLRIGPGLQREFPPLRSLGATTQLPRPTTPLLGRDRELTDLEALIADPVVRLVTLTGPGGAGKTRLALEAATLQVASFEDGVYFVPLAAAVEREVVWAAIAETLDLPADSRISSLLPAFPFAPSYVIVCTVPKIACDGSRR